MSLKQNDEFMEQQMEIMDEILMKPESSQLNRIEAKLDRLLEILDKPKVKRTPKQRKEYHPEFEECWKLYPKRNGTNSKYKAESAWINRVKEADDKTAEMALMLEGARRYRVWCEATNKMNTEYVMQAARFFGRSKEYENSWDVPRETKLPQTYNEWIEVGIDYHVMAKPGESMNEFQERVKAAIYRERDGNNVEKAGTG